MFLNLIIFLVLIYFLKGKRVLLGIMKSFITLIFKLRIMSYLILHQILMFLIFKVNLYFMLIDVFFAHTPHSKSIKSHNEFISLKGDSILIYVYDVIQVLILTHSSKPLSPLQVNASFNSNFIISTNTCKKKIISNKSQLSCNTICNIKCK